MYINDLYKNDFIRNKETIKQELEKKKYFGLLGIAYCHLQNYF